MNYVEEFLEYIEKIKGYSPLTIKGYKEDIKEYFDIVDNSVNNIDYDDIKKYLERLYNLGLRKNSISRKISALKSYYNYLEDKEKISVNYFYNIKIPKKDKILPNFLKTIEVENIINSTNEQIKFGQRDRLILELLYGTGVRVSELVNIKVNDINIHNRMIKVLGKGNKERIVVFGNYCQKALELYLNSEYLLLNKNNSEYLLLNKNGNKLSDRYIRNIISKYKIISGINNKVSPHTFRHTFATDMINNGADLISVKELLGHSSINTTSIYTHVTDEHIKEVYNNTHPRAKE